MKAYENYLKESMDPDTRKETWRSIQERYAKEGKHHHLKLHCTECNNTMTCRCAAVKKDEYGICPECAEKMKMNDSQIEPVMHYYW
jgi:hypothetical protein